MDFLRETGFSSLMRIPWGIVGIKRLKIVAFANLRNLFSLILERAIKKFDLSF